MGKKKCSRLGFHTMDSPDITKTKATASPSSDSPPVQVIYSCSNLLRIALSLLDCALLLGFDVNLEPVW